MADNTASLVVALSAQLTKFEKDMRAAGIMADKAVDDIENKFSKMNPKVSTSFLGNFFSNLATRGLDMAVKAIGELVDRFSELQKTAAYTETSVQWIYGLQVAGEKAGASFADMSTALKAVAYSLDLMQRGGDSALKTLFDANPKFVTMNRSAMTAADALTTVFNIMHNMSQLRAIDVGKNLGMPEAASIAAWKEGGAAIREATEAAAKAGPDLQRLAEINKQFTEAMTAAWQTIKTYIVDNIIPGLKDSIRDLIEWMEWLQKAFKNGPLDMSNAITSLQKFQSNLDSPKRVPVTGGTPGGKGSAVDPFGVGGSAAAEGAWSKANDQITKHIALMNADTAAVGLNAGEHEKLRTTAILTTAANKQFGEVSAETAAKIADQATAAGQAAQALAVATDKMQKINSASQTLGSALSNAFADAVLEGKKLDEVMQSLLKTLARAAINASIMNLFMPGAGGGLSPFSKMLGFAGGTNYAPGGLAIVGEQGPELVNLPRGSQVIPNSVARSYGGGGVMVAPVYNIDASGADQAAIARLQAALIATNRSIESRAVAAINSHMVRGA